MFFETLDEELDKVNEFYGSRESEFVERGDSLREQLGILLEFKRILEHRRRKTSPAGGFSRSSSFSPRHSNFSGNLKFFPIISLVDTWRFMIAWLNITPNFMTIFVTLNYLVFWFYFNFSSY